MKEQLNQLVEAIIEDYRNWSERSKQLNGFNYDIDERTAEFRNGISIRPGKKYIKIVKENSVWGFVMADDDAKFRKGDILKAASWKAPALNKPRGNILDGGYNITWCGPNYL